MRVSVLASGSKGNCTYIETNEKKILVDIGTTCKNIEQKLEELKVNPEQIDAIFISHIHNDHISALKVFQKKYHPLVFITPTMIQELVNENKFFPIEKTQYLEETFQYGDIKIQTIKTSHDTEDSHGFLFTSRGKSIVYITDTGYIHTKYFPLLQNQNLYIFESNHDIEKLMDGPYSHELKIRILSDRGHLSNQDASYYLSKFIGQNTHYIILAHLSEENNTEEIAYQTLTETLKETNKIVEHIIIAKQKERTELIEV